jgi:hypothetical protein
MTMATMTRVKAFDTTILERTEARTARRKFSAGEVLTVIGLLTLFPIVFPILMRSAYFQEKKMEQSGFYD